MPSATVKKRQGKPPLIVPPPGPHVRRPKGWKPPPPNTRRDKALQRFLDDLLKSKNKGGKVLYRDTGGKTHAELTKDHESHKRKGKKAPPHPHVGRLGSQRIRKRIAKAAESYPLSKKRHGGGMSHVGLYPAEEKHEGKTKATGTVSEATREENIKREAKGGGKVLETKKKKKKKQGYKARKDESIAERVKKKRTPKQLKASRHESYGKPGSGKGKGKINRVSSKQTDGNKLVASLYD